MVNVPARLLAVAVATIAFAASIGGCGFSDTLTSRGFIKEGDQVCVDTLVKTGVGFRSRPNITQRQFYDALAGAYARAASGFRRLQVRSDDQTTRDKVVAQFSSISDRLGAASREAASGGDTRSQSRPAFSDISSTQRELRAYGFDVCGGGGGSPVSKAVSRPQ